MITKPSAVYAYIIYDEYRHIEQGENEIVGIYNDKYIAKKDFIE